MALSDEELRRIAQNLNIRIADALILHQTDVIKFMNGEVRRLLQFFNQVVFPDIIRQLDQRLTNISDRGFDVSPSRNRRLKFLITALDDIITKGIQSSHAATKGRLQAFSAFESQATVSLLGRMIPIALELDLPSPGQMRAIITARPFQGRFLREWFNTLGVNLKQNLREAIQVGMTQGDTVAEIVRRVRGTRGNRFTDGILQTTRREAEMVVRTAVSHVASQARERLYEDNANLVKRVQYVAVLDTRTTIICASLDGKIFEVGKGPRPPMHRNCRSTTVPDIDFLSIPGFRGLPETTRASLGGPVPSTRTYSDWLKRQTPAAQKRVLGATRYRLFKSGVPMDKFINDQFQVLTLPQLAKLEGIDLSLAA